MKKRNWTKKTVLRNVSRLDFLYLILIYPQTTQIMPAKPTTCRGPGADIIMSDWIAATCVTAIRFARFAIVVLTIELSSYIRRNRFVNRLDVTRVNMQSEHYYLGPKTDVVGSGFGSMLLYRLLEAEKGRQCMYIKWSCSSHIQKQSPKLIVMPMPSVLHEQIISCQTRISLHSFTPGTPSKRKRLQTL